MKKIFITGASSGIGRSLALAYAKKKCLIGLSARRIEILNDVSKECKRLGGIPFVYELDVQNSDQCEIVSKAFIKDADGVDCVIANAGIGGDDQLYSGSSKSINNVLKTNILGVTNTLMPFIPYMRQQRNGYLVCISSVASYVPLPFHGGYASSKIAIRMIFDSWRPTLERHNIRTISICPGFVDTPIVKGPARKLPMKSPDKAAEKFIKVIAKGKNTYVYPWHYKILIFIANIVPKWLYNYVIRTVFHKPIN